ncbi:AAA family ATPase [Knoellia aerolata]|uniref:Chromosome partitioning protein n=1 Tax=Knoellia aerolata DSM 18566 TaxID=1385519 RepID=A0A0A0JXS8_9MICO|nr:AAA family ATPase [Knoellia aerolata]KGN40877.1 chromosome partitioning protein [Knoellia aerolata DSM 18566]
MNILWDADPTAIEKYRFALGNDTQALDSAAMVARVLHDNLGVQQVIIGPEVALDPACELAESARLDRPELGVILLRHRVDVTTLSQALRSGMREVVTADDHTALADALRRSRELTSKLVGHTAGGSGQEGNIITVFSAKGGVGKTTMSTNIGTYLARTGSKTLLVDLDLSFGDVAISLQLIPARSVFDAVGMSGHLDEQGLGSLVTTHEDSGLDVVCAPNDPSDADRIPVHVVTELLKVARKHYDYIIVDTPPSFTEQVLAACDISSALVLIATLDIPAVKNLRVAIDTLDMLGSPKDARIIVLNRADAKVGLRPEDVVTAIKTPIAVNIPSSMTVPASVNRGVPIVLDDPKGPVSVAIRELCDAHIRQRFGSPVNGFDTRQQRKGLFRGRR